MSVKPDDNMHNLTLVGIYEISKILTSSLDLENGLREVLNLLSSFLQLRRGVVAVVRPGGRLEALAATHATRRDVERGDVALPPDVLREAIATGMPTVVGDLRTDGRFQGLGYDADVGAEETASYVAAPIKRQGQTIGVLGVVRVRDRRMALRMNMEADVRFLTMVANLIGQTVKMHQIVAEERERLMLEKHRAEKELRRIERPLADGPINLVGASPRMRDLFEQIRRIAPAKTTVMVRGESGTGKELVAQAIHQLSPRKAQPFVKVNCAALSESLLESELFGHEKGAFTGAQTDRKGRFELANGGTLFLDEIGEISAAFQAKLLRVLQEGEFERVGGVKTIKVDVRMICATNRNLEDAVARGAFRADLYYRVNVVTLFLPPLRQRTEDIPTLAEHFVSRFNADNKRHVRISPAAMDVIQACKFPGNVRELENCVNRAATLAPTDEIRHADMPCMNNQCLSAVLWKYRNDDPMSVCEPVFVQGASAAPASGSVAPPAPAAPTAFKPPPSFPSPTPPAPPSPAATNPAYPAASSPSPVPDPTYDAAPAYAPSSPVYVAPAPSFAPPPASPASAPTPGPISGAAAADPYAGYPGEGGDSAADASLGALQKDRLVRAMERAGWVQAKAARLLGLTPRQIGYALRKYNIDVKRI